MIAPYCFITDSDHRNQERYFSVAAQVGIIEDTFIGENVWIGSHCQILKGVHLGDNSIVGANSTVLKGIYPPEVLLVGSPSKIKKRIFDIKGDV
jgi:acetyltransferase-like isoleucine patch superfamily enzyme